MSLPLPNLDDRRWEDLVEEGTALIPRYAPEWTDHNIHDPGITLIELFAWLAEMNIYRLNQVPDRHRRKFLSLVGFSPLPPRAAQTMLAFTPESGSPFQLRTGLIFETAKAARFQTLQDLTVVGAKLAAVQVDSGDGPRNHWRVVHSGLPFAPLGPAPQPGAALYLGFDAPLPWRDELSDGSPVSLGFHFTGDQTGPAERARLIEEARLRAEACRPARPEIKCAEGPDDGGATGEPGLPPHHSVRTVWEFFSTEGGGRWVTLRPETDEVLDDTRAFTLNGTMRLALPSAMAATIIGDVDRALYYVRCRLKGGRYDAAPQLAGISLNAVVAEQAIPAWQRFSIAPDTTMPDTSPVPGDMIRLSFNLDDEGTITKLAFPGGTPDWPEWRVLEFAPPDAVAGTPGRLTLELVWLGKGAGVPDQERNLPLAPVLANSVDLFTLEEDSSPQKNRRTWTRQEDLDASRRTDAHYTLDATTGQVVFGDGQRGLVPSGEWSLWPKPGSLLLASYDRTEAENGNVPAGSVTQVADVPHNVWLLADEIRSRLSDMTTNPVPAEGGAAAETLAHAIGRAVERLWAHEQLQTLCEQYACRTLDQVPAPAVRALLAPSRAVNTLDIERLALDVPGTQVRRARAWANLHANYPCLKAVGVVTVVIVPALPLGRPEPSQGLLVAVRRYLDRRRIVTTRIEVVGPRYIEVRIQAQVRRCPGVDPNRLAAEIVAALNTFLDPLIGGPDGHGWPFGRDVYRAEILQVIDGVDGVEYVRELNLMDDRSESQCGNLCVGPTWLVTPGPHQIEVA